MLGMLRAAVAVGCVVEAELLWEPFWVTGTYQERSLDEQKREQTQGHDMSY